jgi:hypothetical protein
MIILSAALTAALLPFWLYFVGDERGISRRKLWRSAPASSA